MRRPPEGELGAQGAQPGLEALQALAHAVLVGRVKKFGGGKALRQRGGKRQWPIHLDAVEGQAIATALRVVDQQAVPPLHIDSGAVDHPGIGAVRVTLAPSRPAGLGLGSPSPQAVGRRRGKTQQSQTQ